MKRAVFAWDAGRGVLVLACPSSRGGMHLVAVGPAGENLAVVHECPAAKVGRLCWHVAEAVRAYQAWRPDRPFRGLRTVSHRVRLDRKWEQIPLPGGEEQAGAKEEAL